MEDYSTLDSKKLGAITADFIKVDDILKEAVYVTRTRGGYEYPIVILSQSENIGLGSLLIEKDLHANAWAYHLTYLDILVKNGVVSQDKIEDFKSSYKNPDEFCCLLVLDQDFTNFLHIPYPEN